MAGSCEPVLLPVAQPISNVKASSDAKLKNLDVKILMFALLICHYDRSMISADRWNKTSFYAEALAKKANDRSVFCETLGSGEILAEAMPNNRTKTQFDIIRTRASSPPNETQAFRGSTRQL